MGNCFKSCLPQSDATRALRNLNILSTQNNDVDFTFLVEDNTSTCEETKSDYRLFPNSNKNKATSVRCRTPSSPSHLCKTEEESSKSTTASLLNRQIPVFEMPWLSGMWLKKPVLELVDGILNPQLTSYSRLSESQRLPSTGSCTSRDIQLQCLDAGALLQRTATSSPASSLDLEWEHETLPISINNEPSGSSCHKYWKYWRREECQYPRNYMFPIETAQRIAEHTRLRTAIPEDLSQCPSNSSPQNTAPAHNSDSDWSRVSSANSLEWDNVQNSIHASSHVSEIDTDTQFLLSEIERLTNKTLQETGQDLFS